MTTDALPEGIINLYFTTARARASVSAAAPLVYNATTGQFSIAAASGAVDGYLSSIDWTTFNGKQAAITGGTNRILFTSAPGSVTSDSGFLWDAVNAQFSVTGGADFAGSVLANSFALTASLATDRILYLNGSKQIIPINPVAAPLDFTAGVLSIPAAAIAYAKIQNVAASAILGSIAGGASIEEIQPSAPLSLATVLGTPRLRISLASGSTNGYLSSTDWTTFNGKQNALTFGNLTAGSSKVSIGGTGTAAVIGAGASVDVVEANLSLANLGGTAGPTQGGTGLTTVTIGDLMYGSASNVWSRLAGIATGNVLLSGGVLTAPAWGKVGLTTHVSGALPAINGGSGQSTVTTGDLLYGSATNTWSKLAGVATGNVLISGGVTTAPAWGKVALTTHVSGVLPTANGGLNLSTFTAANRLLYSTSASVLTTLASTASRVMVSTAGGVPSWDNQLPDHLGVGYAADTVGSLKTLNAIWCGGGDGSGAGSGSAFGFSVYTGFILGHGNAGALFACGRGNVSLHPFTGFTGYDWGSLSGGVGRTIYFGGGAWDSPDANYHEFYTAPTYTEAHDTGSLRLKIWEDGKVGIGPGSQPTALLDVESNVFRLRTAKTPATAAAAGNQGDICWDTSFIYVCTATNTWKRVAIATW